MNVKELIMKLKLFPPDMRVVIDGYEGGYDDVNDISKIGIIPNVNVGEKKKWYYGEHGPRFNDETEIPTETALRLYKKTDGN